MRKGNFPYECPCGNNDPDKFESDFEIWDDEMGYTFTCENCETEFHEIYSIKGWELA